MTTTTNVNTASLDELRALRDELTGEAETILTRSESGLVGTDREDFEQLEQRLRVVAARIELRQRAELPAHLAGLIPDQVVSGGHGVVGSTDRNYGLPTIYFNDENIHALHDSYMSNRADSITADLEIRATGPASPPPMSAIPAYRPDPIVKRTEPTRIADLMPAQQVSNVQVSYYRQSTSASGALTVAEGAGKPESVPGWTAVTATVRKIAHFTLVSKESLDDYANFNRVVADEMVRGLINAENLQVLLGDGTGTNLTGLLNASNILTYAPGGAEDRAKSLLHAKTLLRNGASFAEPDTIVLNPSDLEILDLTNYATAGLHSVMDLNSGTARGSWGTNVVLSSQMTAGIAIVANLAEAAVVFSREPASVFVDPYTLSDSNMVRFICEERIGLGILRPTSIEKVTFSGTA